MESFSEPEAGVVRGPKGTKRMEAKEPETQLTKRITRGKHVKYDTLDEDRVYLSKNSPMRPERD